MPYDYTIQRPYKHTPRSVAVSPSDKSARVAVFLPGRDAPDVQEALDNGTITKTTRVIAIECNKEIAVELDALLRRLGLTNYVVYDDKLETLELDTVLDEGQKIDFAFLDICNQVSPKILQWMLNNEAWFADGAAVALTFSTHNRGNPLLNAMRAVYPKTWKFVARQLPKKRTMFTCLEHNRPSTEATIFGAYATWSVHRNIKITDCIEYSDCTPMLMLRFIVGGQRDKTAKTTRELLKALKAAQEGRLLRRRRAWQALNCPCEVSSGVKAALVRKAKAGQRAPYQNPAQWAHCKLNPQGRQHKLADRVRDAVLELLMQY